MNKEILGDKSVQKEKKAKVIFIYEGQPIKIKGSNILKTKKQK